jgi:hypothetical protein
MAEIEIPKSTGESEASRDSFNNAIAIAVALLSVFMGVSKVKDDNIVQAMQKAQVESVDRWNEYQARRQRWFGLEVAIAQTKATQSMTPELEAKLAEWKKNADNYQARAEEAATKARAREADYNAGNDRDDLFDLSDAFLSVAIAMFAVTALVRKRWLFGMATVLALGGVTFGIAGFNGWTWIKPGFLVEFLS